MAVRVIVYMDTSADPGLTGQFEARYLAFLETITHLRPKLHRYCSRMTGSVLDGEDVVQDALFQAYRKLHSFDDTRPLGPWLFRIAHNRCIDFLRRRKVRHGAEAQVLEPDAVEPPDPAEPILGRAIEHLMQALPPKERACVLLKDVFDYSLEETAELVDSTVGGVKAALSRGRTKLAALPDAVRSPRRPAGREMSRLLELYVERFNRRDWDGLRELITADARVQVADRFAGLLSDSPYFGNLARRSIQWRVAAGEVDGEPVVVTLHGGPEAWVPQSIARLDSDGERILRIVDYVHCPWILPAARSVVVAAS